MTETGRTIRLLGVDVSGTESACLSGAPFPWRLSDSAEARAIARWHADAVRVPLNEDCWLGVNAVPPAASGQRYRRAVASWVAALNHAGLVAVLDLHWAAPGGELSRAQWPMADASHSVDFWAQVAGRFKADPSVVFDLYNEPYIGRQAPTGSDWACWRDGCERALPVCTQAGAGGGGPACTTVTYRTAGMQQLLDAVRRAGARQPVMVGGLEWAGDPCDVHGPGAGGHECAWLAYEPADPAHQLVASFHSYNWTTCASASCWESSVASVARRVPVVTGELGERDCAASYVDAYMRWADAHGVSYLAWDWRPQGAFAGDCAKQDLSLVADWRGAPALDSPVAQAFSRHLASLAGSA